MITVLEYAKGPNKYWVCQSILQVWSVEIDIWSVYHDGIGWKTRVKFVISQWVGFDLSILSQIGWCEVCVFLVKLSWSVEVCLSVLF